MSVSYDVQTVCEVTDLYNYVVKWEISPLEEGVVKIYTSTNPDHFDLRYPVKEELISKGRADIMIKGSMNRRYFLLQFNDDVKSVVGVRSQKFAEIQNFRDLGGYKNKEKKHLKWGTLYRTGNLDSIGYIAAKRLQCMHIHSLVDLRMDNQTPHWIYPPKIKNYYHYPLKSKRQNPLPLILNQRFKRGDAIVFMQDVCCEMVTSNKESLKSIFDLLASSKNYPIVFECKYGNLQTSLVIALILSALDIPEQTIIDDYVLSNKYFDMRPIARLAAKLPLESQDAITSMMVSEESYLQAVFSLLKNRYGSVNEFLRQELGVDDAFRAKLKLNLMN